MDKPDRYIATNRKEKKGFALLITLSVLAVLIALTGVLLSYFDTVRKDAAETKAVIQGDLYYTDIKNIINSFKEKKTLFSTLYMMPVPLVSSDARFNVMLQCRPRANGVNINWLSKEDDPKMEEQYKMAQRLFESIVQNYDLEDASRLEELILKEIQDKSPFIQKSDNRLFQKNGIISFKQFKRILQQYQFETNDEKISRIPWNKYFIFSEKSGPIDGNYLSAELIAVLFDIDIESVREEWTEGTMNLKDFVTQMGGTFNDKLYAKEFVEEAKCSVQYTYQDEQFEFSFIDSEGEVKDFEFNGKQ